MTYVYRKKVSRYCLGHLSCLFACPWPRGNGFKCATNRKPAELVRQNKMVTLADRVCTLAVNKLALSLKDADDEKWLRLLPLGFSMDMPFLDAKVVALHKGRHGCTRDVGDMGLDIGVAMRDSGDVNGFL